MSSPQGNSHSPNRGSFQMPTAPGMKLAQEIHDEFLLCKICLEGYKNPKSLNCLHTFCEQCIENHVLSESTYKKYTDYRDFTCPLCRKRTQLPIGGVKKLPDNFLVSSLSELVQRQKPSKFPFCDICKNVNNKHREATSKCLDCAKLLCAACVALHKDTKVTSGHSLFDIEIEKDIECKEHQDEVVRFYCEPCETCICVLCTFNEHKDHEITQFADAVVKYKENIKQMLDKCKGKITKFDTQVESLNKCEEVIKGVTQQVHDTAIAFIQEIRSREKSLIEELENLYGKEIMDMIENKKDLCTQAESLRSTCSLTEVILKGKDIELLLLKKDVQQKLSTLNSIELKNPPKTVSKMINYVPGEIDMGYIHDLDRPLLTKMRIPRQGSKADNLDVYHQMVTRVVQTDEQGRTKHESIHCATSDDEDSDESSEEESSDEEDDKPEMVDFGVQTVMDPVMSESEDDDSGPETTEQGTMTDTIKTEEKAVNTRSRSLQTVPGKKNSPPKEEDNSLAARRRRRRERAQMGAGHSIDEPESYEDRRKRNSGFYNRSLDQDDVFYDAPGLGHRV